MIETIVESFTFIEILILLLVLGVFCFTFFAIGGSIKGKKTTVSFGSKKGTENLLVILEAFKLKDDIYEIDGIVISRQKKYLRSKLPEAREIQLSLFSQLQQSRMDVKDLENYNPFEDRDYLYYSLMIEKMYSNIFRNLVEIYDEQDVAIQFNSPKRQRDLAENVFNDESTIVDSLYIGVEGVPKPDHDAEMSKIKNMIIEKITECVAFAAEVSEKGSTKKDELKSRLLEKAGQIEGVSTDQISGLFSTLSEDFIN